MVTNKRKELQFSNYQFIINCFLDFQKTFPWWLFTLSFPHKSTQSKQCFVKLISIALQHHCLQSFLLHKNIKEKANNQSGSKDHPLELWCHEGNEKMHSQHFISQPAFSEPVLNALCQIWREQLPIFKSFGSCWSALDLFNKSKNFQFLDTPSIEICLSLALSSKFSIVLAMFPMICKNVPKYHLQ